MPGSLAPSEPSQVAARSKLAEDRLASGLYVVATPIGNLGDITRRAVDVLSRVDVIACEDTRVTAHLIRALGLAARAKLLRYDEHVADSAGAKLLDRIAAGASVALAADAGTPLLADPGQRLVAGARQRGLAVNVIPGPSAVIAALIASGLPTERFMFVGFLPQRAGPRARSLAALVEVAATLVIFEAPHRLPESLAAMADILGARSAAVVREMTKLFEETRRGTLAELAAHYAAAGPPNGEVVVVIAPPAPSSGAAAAEPDQALDARLAEALSSMSVRDAAAQVAVALKLPRRQVYARALALTGAKTDAP
jgi:16S rRNA (cytidine1402-2'-O)-methyltransferase